MTTELTVGATSNHQIDWHSINWKKVHQHVRRLQTRIVKAFKEGNQGKVRSLTWLLTNELSAKALAVKQVIGNRGARTSGVDGEIWNTPLQKSKAIQSLSRQKYKASPLKRKYILKSNGKRRPLGIPTMKDRAMQALYALALAPIAETTADPNSYGFRRNRSTRDATLPNP